MAMQAAALTALLLQFCFSATAVAQVTGALPGCPSICAGVSVPYPFGISPGCFLPGFNLTCDRALGRERLLIGGAGGTLEVVEISLANSTVRVMDTAGAVNLTGIGNGTGLARLAANGKWGGLGDDAFAGPFVVSGTRNRFVLTGCNLQATLLGEGGNVIVGCSAFCPVTDMFLSTISPAEVAACAGVGCCETPIPIGRPSYSVQLAGLDLNQEMDQQLPIAVRIAETGWFEGNSVRLLNKSLPDSSSTTAIAVVLEWVVDSKRPLQPQDVATGCPQDAARSVCRSSLSSCLNVTNNYRTGYVCQCKRGYQGNPYLTNGCQDIDECKLPDMFMCFGLCTNTPGAYQCQCAPGFRGNPKIKDGCVKSSLGLGVGIGIASGAGLLLLNFFQN